MAGTVQAAIKRGDQPESTAVGDRTAPRLNPYAARGPVVVAVDATPRSVPALRWAAEEAWRRFTDVVAVHISTPPRLGAAYTPVHPPVADALRRLEKDSEVLAEQVRAALGSEPLVPVHEVCESSSAVHSLLTQAEGASLLVLTAGTDEESGRDLGATTLTCLRHSLCPVVILPST